MENKKRMVSLQLPCAMLQAIDHAAAECGICRSEWLRLAARKELRRTPPFLEKSPPQQEENQFLIEYHKIPLTQGKFTLVDKEDFEKFGRLNWCAKRGARTFYAQRGFDGHTILLHRLILDAPDEFEVDHINGDGLDNRKENLRLVSKQQNGFNRTHKRRGCSSQYRGVSWDKGKNKWQARIKLETGKQKHLGHFACEEEAARAYDAAGFERDPDHFTPNFPRQEESR